MVTRTRRPDGDAGLVQEELDRPVPQPSGTASATTFTSGAACRILRTRPRLPGVSISRRTTSGSVAAMRLTHCSSAASAPVTSSPSRLRTCSSPSR
jgi:hypothetical protein